MSILDIIKNLFSGNTAEQPVSEQANTVATKPEVKPKPAPVSSPSPKKRTESSEIPEDSTLRRHYLANLEAEKQPKVAKEKAAVEKKPKPVAAKAKKTIEKPASETVAKIQVPEDSTLKRHFISALKAEIEASMGACPTDETLKRRYNEAVQAELDKKLA